MEIAKLVVEQQRCERGPCAQQPTLSGQVPQRSLVHTSAYPTLR